MPVTWLRRRNLVGFFDGPRVKEAPRQHWPGLEMRDRLNQRRVYWCGSPSQQLRPKIPFRIHVSDKPAGRLRRLAATARNELAAAGIRHALVAIDDDATAREHGGRPAPQLASRKRRVAGKVVHHLV